MSALTIFYAALFYAAAAVLVVGVGNNIIDQKALAAGDRAQVIKHARGFLELASQVSAGRQP